MANAQSKTAHRSSRYETVIIGGGVIGSSLAYHLALESEGSNIAVVEPDPSYALAASPRAVGTVRRVFGMSENVALSQYGHEFYGDFAERMAVNGERPDIGLRREGYLFMVWGKEAVAGAEAVWRIATDRGAPVELIDGRQVEALHASIDASDVDAALWSPKDMWIDPHAALTGFARKARNLGVHYIEDRVVDLAIERSKVVRARLASGSWLSLGRVVNCANCWAPDICAMVGLRIPVEPMRHQTFFFECRQSLPPLPITRDLSGLSFRPEGAGYIVGMTHLSEPRGFNWEVDYQWFDEAIWPALAHRVPAFEAVKAGRAWSGHYDQNALDGNPILGYCPGAPDNFAVAAGFSGHGLQHAPGIGRGLAELLAHGEYRSLDLSCFGYQRVLDGAPLVDVGPPS